MPKPLPQVPVEKGLKLKKPKKCNCCGLEYIVIPKDSPFMSDMYWYDCQCKSTHVVTEDMLDEKS